MNWLWQFIMKIYNLEMEYIKDFDNWNIKKKTLNDALSKAPYFKEREIWWLSIGVNIGFEEDGKHEDFLRPVLIMKKFNKNMFLGIPLSTKIKMNPYYIVITAQGKTISAMISQLRVFSSKRLVVRLGKLEAQYYIKIQHEVQRFFVIPLSPRRKSRA